MRKGGSQVQLPSETLGGFVKKSRAFLQGQLQSVGEEMVMQAWSCELSLTF